MRNTDDFLIFFHLIEQGSFSKAAEQVGLTKSVVSKRITRLEEELGVQLLYRTTRKLTLTEAGDVFFSHAPRGLPFGSKCRGRDERTG